MDAILVKPSRPASDRGFSLIELLITILVLSILTGIAVPLFISIKGKANSSTTQANHRIGESMMTMVWMRIMDNGGGIYRDPKPPGGMTAPANVDAEYLSRIQKKTKFWRVKRQGNRFQIAGVYKDGELLPGTGTWDSTLTDWSIVSGIIGISFETYWDNVEEEFESNVTGDAGKRYRHDMTIVMNTTGDAYWTTYFEGAPIAGGGFRDPGWDDGRGTPE